MWNKYLVLNKVFWIIRSFSQENLLILHKNPGGQCSSASFFLLITLLLLSTPGYAFELQGTVRVDERFFSQEPAYIGQNRHKVSLGVEAELYHA
ncbi:MAG: hypothetical protein D3924_06665, partial [Candidatus Electrothrix sp. AR4]|nr:hypothetical protein [Candidatus Electrothrix sp. AR4]